MTWKDFKKQIETLGVKDEDEIIYIDAGTFYDEPYEFTIEKKENGFVIT